MIIQGNRNWINQHILYIANAGGELNFIDARAFFLSFKMSWIRIYAYDKLDDHWSDIIDKNQGVRKRARTQALICGPGALRPMINSDFPCMQGHF